VSLGLDPSVFRASGLGQDGVYTVLSSGFSFECWAHLSEGSRLGHAGSGFDREFASGLARYAEARLDASEFEALGVEAPARGDTLLHGGVTWRVEQPPRRSGGMWLALVSADKRGGGR